MVHFRLKIAFLRPSQGEFVDYLTFLGNLKIIAIHNSSKSKIGYTLFVKKALKNLFISHVYAITN